MWDAATRQRLRDRVERLAPTAVPAWGKMNVAGMLAHLNDSFRMATGDLEVASKHGPLRYPPLRQLVVYLLPIPKGVPTAPELIARTDTAQFTDEQRDFHALVERLDQIVSGSQLVPHPLFGTLSYREYGVLMARHTDHHLRQFGV
jgi:hypothetical protein